MPNNVLTASRQGCLLRCMRAHFWQYEVGLRKDREALALTFGSAWHRAMEARWKGATHQEALEAAITPGLQLDPYEVAKCCALLLGYFEHYGERETCAQIQPEIQFKHKMGGALGLQHFTVEGKIDGLGTLQDGRPCLVESKTTSDKIDETSDYWLRLRFNTQLIQYVLAAAREGWSINVIIYDVVHKPKLKPKDIPDRDAQGFKIVVDANGQRVMGKKDKPRQTPDEDQGWTLKTHDETPDEYFDRLLADIRARSWFYFARREVPILDEDKKEFLTQRKTLANLILFCRSTQEVCERPEQAWPRAISKANCNWCAYKSFCLNNINVDAANVPSGFSIKPFNPELQDESVEQSEETVEQ